MWSLAIHLYLWGNRVIANRHRDPPNPANPLPLFGYIYSTGLLRWVGEWAVDCERGWGTLTSKIPSGACEQKTGRLVGTLTIIKVRRKLPWKRSVIPLRAEQPFYALCAHWGDPAIPSSALLLYWVPRTLWTLPGKVFLYISMSWGHWLSYLSCSILWEVEWSDWFCYTGVNILTDCSENWFPMHLGFLEPLSLHLRFFSPMEGTVHTFKVNFYC